MKMTMRPYLFAAAMLSAVVLWGSTPLFAVQTPRAEAESPEAAATAAGKADQPEKTTGVDRQAIVVMGRNVELKAEDSAEVVVVIGGSAKVHGKVREAVVVIGGDVEVDGDVGDSVIAVFGSVNVKPGAKVSDSVVAVAGDIKVAANTTIKGDTVAVGGSLDLADGAKVNGHTQDVPIPFLRSLGGWVVQCLFKLRPLAPQVGWVWVVAGVFFLFYLLVAAAFPQPVLKCINQLDERPIATFLFGVLAMVLVPVFGLILAITGIGLLVVPFLSLAVFIASVVGKVALLEWVGLRIGEQSGVRALQRPLIGFLVGSFILTLFYNVWVVGFIAYVLFGIWGLGVAVTAVIGGVRRRPAAPAAPLPTPPYFTMPAGGAAGSAGMPAQPGVEPAEPPFIPRGGPGLPEAMCCLRAGFWERMAAGFLDLILLGILTSITHHAEGWSCLIALAYFSGMWAWRGTTVGGIVLGLKVVRLDGQPVTYTVALVRALAAAFSMAVLFLGFFWIAWNSEKQGWHDKISGTVVVRTPKSTPLVCV